MDLLRILTGKLGDFQKPHVLQVLGNPQVRSRSKGVEPPKIRCKIRRIRRKIRREIRREIRRQVRRQIRRPRTLAYPKRHHSWGCCLRSAVRLRSGACQRSASPATLPVAQDSLLPSRSSEVWGPTICLNLEERFKGTTVVLGWVCQNNSRGGDVCLVEGGLGGVARSFAAGALGTL